MRLASLSRDTTRQPPGLKVSRFAVYDHISRKSRLSILTEILLHNSLQSSIFIRAYFVFEKKIISL